MYVSTSDNRIRKIDATSNIITTFAGTGVSTYSGDGGPATLAGFGPSGMAIDSAGNLYFADQSNNRIRKIDVNTNNISTVAGTGSAGSSGDGGLATAAQINGPRGVAFDQWGNLYIAEGSRIRKVTSGSGIITTFAGTGTVGFSGDGGLATAAMLRLPIDLEFDASGNLYFSDNTNQRIRRIDSVSGIITTVAGSGATGSLAGGFSGDGGPATSALLKNPSRIYIDPAGNLYIADANRRIRKVDASTGVISTIVGNGSTSPVGDGGPATAAAINGASGVGMDTAANLYTGEITNPRVRKVNLQLSQLNYPTPTTVGTSSIDNPQTAIVTNIGNASLTVPRQQAAAIRARLRASSLTRPRPVRSSARRAIHKLWALTRAALWLSTLCPRPLDRLPDRRC
jgi:sugar lactone lactonase YvrE